MSKKKKQTNESNITIGGITYDFKVDENNERVLLGEGGGGTVFLAVNNGKEYAIKEFKGSKKGTDVKFLRSKSEIEFLCDSNNLCENIVKVLGKEYIENKLYIVMDKFPSTLRKTIGKKNSHEVIFRIILQLIYALKFIHSKNVYHRDLKPENVLIDNNKNAYLCDFGIAHFPDKRITKPDELLANRNYLAPEAHIIGNSCNATAAIDIYPLGKMINELFTKQNPVGTHFQKIADLFPQFASLDDLVDRMMNQNPAERPSIEEVETRVRFEKETFEEKIQILSQHLLSTGEQNGKTERICKLASLDIYIANLNYSTMDEEHLNAVDINYHQNIHYSATEEFKNYFFQFLLLNECEKKYWGESSSCDEDWDSTGIKQRTTKTQYSKMVSILKGRNKIPKDFLPIQGKILKLFSSCKNYHSDEVLKFCTRAKERVDELNDFPLYYFVKYADKCLKNLLNNELDEIRFEKYIVVNTGISSGKMKNTSIIRKDIYTKRNKLCGILKRLYKCEIIKMGECVTAHFEREKYRTFKDALLLKANKYVSRYPDENRYFLLDVNSALTIVNSTESVVELFFDGFTLEQILGKLYNV